MNVGIIGGGFVGSATALLECEGNDVFIYDLDPDKCKPKGFSLDDLYCCHVVFICVPTPMGEGGACDLSFVKKAVQEVSKVVRRTSIVIRSTVPVGTCEELGVCVMPEFLTEANWRDDFVNCKDRIIGDDSPRMRTSFRVAKLFKTAKECGKIKHWSISTCTTKEAELVKLTRNAFLATKVSFFNEIESFCRSMGISYENVLRGVTMDERIGLSHTSVPGPDGKRGFGGKCFPKDASSLLHQMFQQGIDPYIINASLLRNQEVDRPSQKEPRDVFTLLRPMGRHNERKT